MNYLIVNPDNQPIHPIGCKVIDSSTKIGFNRIILDAIFNNPDESTPFLGRTEMYRRIKRIRKNSWYGDIVRQRALGIPLHDVIHEL